MHNYTVPSKYKHQTRLGNWSEEWEYEETKMKDYLKCKGHGTLQTVQKETKLKLSLQKASLTHSTSGLVSFNDHLMFANEKTQGYLACDINERLGSNEEGYAITTANNIHPCSRSVFIIEKYEKEPDLFQGNQLHYGQKFRIRVNPRLINKPLYLASLPTTPQRCAKFSRYQQVLMGNLDNINTVWIIEHVDPKIRFESNNQPIPVNQPVLIKHVLTQQWLGSDKINYSNIFGSENEVYAHSHSSFNKTQNLIAEKCGRTTVDVPMRNQNEQNTWSFVSAADPSWEFDESLLDQAETASSLINKIRHILIQKGEYGFTGLLNSFKNMDRNSDNQLDKDDFKWGLRNFGFQFNEQEIRLLLSAFDRNNNGFIDFNEFVTTLRGHENNGRNNLIFAVFQSLQDRAGGNLTYTDLIKQFQASRHPDAVKNFKTEREVFQQFVNYFGKREPDYIVTLEEFTYFYSNISCAVDRDDIFEALICNVWNYQK